MSFGNKDDVMEAFIHIREGIAFYLKSKLEIEEDIIAETFRYLIAKEDISKTMREKSKRIIETIKENKEALDMFLMGMRIKTTLMGKQGLSMEAMDLRLHLAGLEMNISETSTQELPSPDEFIILASKFHQKFERAYSVNKD